MALGAAHGRAQPDRRDVAHPVGRVLGDVLLGLGPALLGRLEQPVVARGDRVSSVGRRQQVAGELLDREPVERLVGVERADHVVAEQPDVDVVVAVIARACRRTGPGRARRWPSARRSGARPAAGRPAARRRRRGRRGRRRRPPRASGGRPIRSKREAADQGRAVGLGRRLEPRGRQPARRNRSIGVGGRRPSDRRPAGPAG